MEHVAEWIAIAFTIVGGIVAFSRQSGSFETRLIELERSKTEHSKKLDLALQSLARIEGRLDGGISHATHGD